MHQERKCKLYYCSLHKWMLTAYSIEVLGNYSVTCWDSIWSHLPWKTGQNLLFITQHNCWAGCITEVGEIAEIPILKRIYSCTSSTDQRFKVKSSMKFCEKHKNEFYWGLKKNARECQNNFYYHKFPPGSPKLEIIVCTILFQLISNKTMIARVFIPNALH